MFLGERVPAREARELGMINHAYRREDFDARAGEFIRKLSAKSPAILKLGKQAILRLLDETLPEQERFLESQLAEVMSTEDSKEGLRAFAEKRPPKWD
jgi:enoyl-CoA hydratase/carnithine racemase